MYFFANIPRWIRQIFDHFQPQGKCIEAVDVEPKSLRDVSDQYKTQEMCDIKTLRVGTWQVLEDVPVCFKTRDVCEKAMRKSPTSLVYVLDWFVTQQQIKMWRDDNEYCDDDDDDDDDDDELLEWYVRYQKRRTQKAQIQKELVRVTWHPSRWWDWCVPEDEKKEIDKLWK